MRVLAEVVMGLCDSGTRGSVGRVRRFILHSIWDVVRFFYRESNEFKGREDSMLMGNLWWNARNLTGW